MITIVLMGGLGNQLFGWALGCALEARGNEVQYSTERLDGSGGRMYLLGGGAGTCDLKLKTVPAAPTNRVINEGSLRYKPEILDTRGDTTLIGYWQCEHYFWSVRDRILADLSFTDISLDTHMAAQAILSLPKSCFLHVRRSDNLRPFSTNYHGLTCAAGNPYYERAKAIIREHEPGVHFFVFSDDPAWCKENLKANDLTVMDCNPPSFTEDPETHELTKKPGGREAEDLFLMSLCKHGILANSTFSWWGAWLHRQQMGRIVIAPDPWFQMPPDVVDSIDILPARWLKVSMRP